MYILVSTQFRSRDSFGRWQLFFLHILSCKQLRVTNCTLIETSQMNHHLVWIGGQRGEIVNTLLSQIPVFPSFLGHDFFFLSRASFSVSCRSGLGLTQFAHKGFFSVNFFSSSAQAFPRGHPLRSFQIPCDPAYNVTDLHMLIYSIWPTYVHVTVIFRRQTPSQHGSPQNIVFTTTIAALCPVLENTCETHKHVRYPSSSFYCKGRNIYFWQEQLLCVY